MKSTLWTTLVALLLPGSIGCGASPRAVERPPAGPDRAEGDDPSRALDVAALLPADATFVVRFDLAGLRASALFRPTVEAPPVAPVPADASPMARAIHDASETQQRLLEAVGEYWVCHVDRTDADAETPLVFLRGRVDSDLMAEALRVGGVPGLAPPPSAPEGPNVVVERGVEEGSTRLIVGGVAAREVERGLWAVGAPEELDAVAARRDGSSPSLASEPTYARLAARSRFGAVPRALYVRPSERLRDAVEADEDDQGTTSRIALAMEAMVLWAEEGEDRAEVVVIMLPRSADRLEPLGAAAREALSDLFVGLMAGFYGIGSAPGRATVSTDSGVVLVSSHVTAEELAGNAHWIGALGVGIPAAVSVFEQVSEQAATPSDPPPAEASEPEPPAPDAGE